MRLEGDFIGEAVDQHFPSFSEGLSLRPSEGAGVFEEVVGFPFLFGGTFIEAPTSRINQLIPLRFPFLFGGTFIEALDVPRVHASEGFPFLFGGTFIEAPVYIAGYARVSRFPFLFGGTFIEARRWYRLRSRSAPISLPFRRDFH